MTEKAQLSKEEIQKVAMLAKLKIDDAQLPQTTEDLNNILQLISSISEIDTSQTEPLSHPYEITQRTRSDDIEQVGEKRNDFLSLSEHTSDDLFQVPLTVE